MRPTLVILTLGVASACLAVKVPFKQAKRAQISRRRGGTPLRVSHPSSALANIHNLAAVSNDDSKSTMDLTTAHDLIYMANITIGGNEYPVQFDTGSSDLWIKGATQPLAGSTASSQTYNLTYGIGWAFGTVSYAPAEFAGIPVKSQAFLDVSSAFNPALSYGAVGILGLGFTSLSTIDLLVNSTGGASGRSLLYNMFQDNPQQPNFIAFALQRSLDEGDEVEGSFSIGEYEPAYVSIADTAEIPTWPVAHPTRWNVLVDSIIVGTKESTLSTTVNGVPSNKAVALLDSGTSYSYAPTAVCEMIYGGVAGAKYDATIGQWIVPCDSEINMAIVIAGVAYPIHPLDLSPKGLADPTVCTGSFIPQSIAIGAGEFDWLVGDNVLRSVYSIYDFGDFNSEGKMGNPYVKLLSLVEPNKASADFHTSRGGTPQTNITYNVASGSAAAGGRTTVSLSDDIVNTLNKVTQYFPAMLAVMALNGLVLLALVILAIVFLCKRSTPSAKKTTRGPAASRSATPAHVYEPVSMNNLDPESAREGASRAGSRLSRHSAMDSTGEPIDPAFTPPGVINDGTSPASSIRPHPGRTSPLPGPSAPFTKGTRYDPVSMALSQAETLYDPTPPSPAFRKGSDGGSNLRPKSMAY